jgi:hypothetical protein
MQGAACGIRDWGIWQTLLTDEYGASPYFRFQREAESVRWLLEDCGL